jgi:hypothetical protein
MICCVQCVSYYFWILTGSSAQCRTLRTQFRNVWYIERRSQGESLWNEITNLGGSWHNFVSAMTNLLGGEQRNDGLISSRFKDSSLQGPRPVCSPICLLLYLNRCTLHAFQETEDVKLRTPAAGLKPKNLSIALFQRNSHFVTGCLILTLVPRTHLQLSKFSYCSTVFWPLSV